MARARRADGDWRSREDRAQEGRTGARRQGPRLTETACEDHLRRISIAMLAGRPGRGRRRTRLVSRDGTGQQRARDRRPIASMSSTRGSWPPSRRASNTAASGSRTRRTPRAISLRMAPACGRPRHHIPVCVRDRPQPGSWPSSGALHHEDQKRIAQKVLTLVHRVCRDQLRKATTEMLLDDEADLAARETWLAAETAKQAACLEEFERGLDERLDAMINAVLKRSNDRNPRAQPGGAANASPKRSKAFLQHVCSGVGCRLLRRGPINRIVGPAARVPRAHAIGAPVGDGLLLPINAKRKRASRRSPLPRGSIRTTARSTRDWRRTVHNTMSSAGCGGGGAARKLMGMTSGSQPGPPKIEVRAMDQHGPPRPHIGVSLQW